MTILFLGNFEAEFSSENYYRKTLEEMGHTVITKQENKAKESDLAEAVAYNKIDAFFWVHTHGWATSGIERFLDRIRKVGIVSFAYHLDLYLGIKREIQVKTDPFFTVDHFFTVDKLMADWLTEHGKCKGHFLPAGVYAGECVLGTPNREKYPHDIIFTGAKGYHHEWPYRPKLIEWLQSTYGDRFGHYGNGGMAQVRGLELNNLYASAKIVIGDTLCKNFDYPWYSSDRLFEVCGRGGFLIYPHIEGLQTLYSPDEVEYYNFNDFGMLKDLIDYHLLPTEEVAIEGNTREQMRLAALERTKHEHTYKHRLQFILDTLCK